MPLDTVHLDPTSLDVFRLLLDFGLVVLVWTVQLIVYPSFLFANRSRLAYWHGRYTVLISFLVIPLMLGQVAVVGLQVAERGTSLDWLSAALVALVWLVTFVRAVPLHERIGEGGDPEELVTSLVRWNWPRTVLWTVTFVVGWLGVV